MSGDVSVTLAECPVGLFWAGDTLGMKTEYADNNGQIDAYIVRTGEFFWGSGPNTIANQRNQLVEPIDFDPAVHALSFRRDFEYCSRIDWKSCADEMPVKPHGALLVTNNMKGRTSSGHMSHAWCVDMLHQHGNEISAFHTDVQKIWGITHWAYVTPLEGGEA